MLLTQPVLDALCAAVLPVERDRVRAALRDLRRPNEGTPEAGQPIPQVRRLIRGYALTSPLSWWALYLGSCVAVGRLPNNVTSVRQAERVLTVHAREIVAFLGPSQLALA